MIKRMVWCSLAAVLASAGSLQAQTQPNKAAAIVNGEVIPLAEVQALLKQQPPPANPQTESQKAEMRQIACNMLIDDVLMRQFLRKNAPPANIAEVHKELKELEQALAKEKPAKTIQEFLKDSGQSEEQLKLDIAARLQWKGYILPRLPDNVVKQYYDTNKVFFDKVFVRASHVLVKVAESAPQPERQRAYERILAIKQELAGGKIDFAAAAKKYSDCPTKDNGGDLGPFPYKFSVVEPFAKAAFSLKVGETSDVVTTEFGYHLIKVTDRSAGQPSNFEAIKDQVREIYAQEVHQSILYQQRKTAKIEMQTP